MECNDDSRATAVRELDRDPRPDNRTTRVRTRNGGGARGAHRGKRREADCQDSESSHTHGPPSQRSSRSRKDAVSFPSSDRHAASTSPSSSTCSFGTRTALVSSRRCGATIRTHREAAALISTLDKAGAAVFPQSNWTSPAGVPKVGRRMRTRPVHVCRRLASLVTVIVTAALLASVAPGVVAGRNGTLIAFTRWFPAPRQFEIALVGIDGRGLRPLRTGVIPSYEPEWSPDGRRLLFRGGRTDDLYLIRPDGSGRRQLTRDRAHEQAAAWSPDGTRIAYQRWAPNTESSIWVLRPTTGASRRLTR